MASNSDDSNDYNDLEVAAVLANVSHGLDQDTRSSGTSNSVVDYSPFTLSSSLASAVRENTSVERVYELVGNVTINQLASQGELLILQQVFTEECVNAVDEHGKTPLMSAVGAGWRHVVVFCLERGANPDLVDLRSTTALMQACCLGHKSIVSALLEYNADINCMDNASNTALHYAVFGNHPDCVQRLLDSGADMTVANVDGLTALELASKLCYKDVQDTVYAHLLQALSK